MPTTKLSFSGHKKFIKGTSLFTIIFYYSVFLPNIYTGRRTVHLNSVPPATGDLWICRFRNRIVSAGKHSGNWFFEL